MSDFLPTSTPPRFVVGIDLGTTNCALAYVDTESAGRVVQNFLVPQLVAPGQVDAREVLPSFHYQAAAGEFAARALALPWSDESPQVAVGTLARDHGSLVPGRMVASAKSWLCHSGVDRRAGLLPWHGAPDVARLSPVDVSAAYLAHLRAAWDAKFHGYPLAEQDVVLTLPASFDEAARELTVEAAAQAGLPRIILIEEPQAAFYSWIARHEADWESRVRTGDKILVCDVGGGTTDFTLIRVRPGQQGKVQFHRVAVGDHLILGGDNLDLALAHALERKLPEGKRLEPRSWAILQRACRAAKETLLAADAPERLAVHVGGAGAKLIGGGMSLEIGREEARQILVEGFFPRVPLDARPAPRQSGFQEFGLPYAPDPAITKYLAAFLTAHRHAGLGDEPPATDHDPARPDKVLLAGGPFNATALVERIVECISGWFSTPDRPWRPEVLESDRLEVMVARGAAYYGLVRRGEGVKISAGLARTYYIGVDGEPPQALCLVPASTEPGSEVDLAGRRFQLLVSQPVEFPLYISSTRLTDPAGQLVAVDPEQMTALPPIRTVLATRKRADAATMDVTLHARLTEIGTLDLWCNEAEGSRRWRLQFDVRAATQTDVRGHTGSGESAGHLDESVWSMVEAIVSDTYSPTATGKPAELMRRLQEAIGEERSHWPPSLLRRIWQALVDVETGRQKSPAHEARWLNLLGFALRPGFGMAVDDWRVAETRKIVQGRLAHAAPAVAVDAWILWRRIAGGLPRGAQLALADPLLKSVRGLHRQIVQGKGHNADQSLRTHDSIEAWRLLGALELLDVGTKIELGGLILDLAAKAKLEPVAPAIIWTLGRLGSRGPVYGPMNAVVPAETIAHWLPRLMDLPLADPVVRLAVMQLARKTGDRFLDPSGELCETTLAWLARQGASEHFLTLVREGGRLDEEEQGRILGESLPKGLLLR